MIQMVAGVLLLFQGSGFVKCNVNPPTQVWIVINIKKINSWSNNNVHRIQSLDLETGAIFTKIRCADHENYITVSPRLRSKAASNSCLFGPYVKINRGP